MWMVDLYTKRTLNTLVQVPLELREQGVSVIGGCCGTTPLHIKAMKDAVGHMAPVLEKKMKQAQVEKIEIREHKDSQAGLYKKAQVDRTILVELDPPKKLGIEGFMQGASALKQAGVDTITLADNSLASPRISNAALGSAGEITARFEPAYSYYLSRSKFNWTSVSFNGFTNDRVR